MLKKMRLGGIVLASLLAATGCQNEEIVQSNGAQGQAFTLVASKGIQSRTELKGDQTVWSVGDKIYVSSKDGNVTGVLTLDPEDAGSTSGTFTGFVFGDPAKLAYSVYPVPTDGKTLDLSEVLGGGQLNAPMIGAISQDPNAETDVQFENVCGVLYVDIEDSENKTLKVSAKEGADTETKEDINFATTATISWDDNTKRPIITFEGSTSEITISNADGDEMYIPYFTTEDDLNDVTFYVGNTPLNDEPIDLSDSFVGSIVMDGIKSLKYEDEEIKVNVAKIGDVTYTSLQEAVTKVEDGGLITLIDDVNFTTENRTPNGDSWYEGIYYVGDKSFTIDLSGKEITNVDGAVNDYMLLFKNEGTKENTITIKNGKIDAGTAAYCALCTSSSNTQQITINLEKVELTGQNSNGSVTKIRGASVLNVKAGTKITGTDSYLGLESYNATVNIYEGAEIYMNGTTSYNGCLVGVGGNGIINVYGGKGTGAKGGFIAMTSGGTINVEGGEWIANTDGTNANDNNSVLVAQSENGAKSVINVTAGTFKGGYNCYGTAQGDAQINISGGNFNADPSTYVAENYKAMEKNGIYHVVLENVDGVIVTEEDLFALGGTQISGTYMLMADLDMTGKEMKPIMLSSGEENALTFNGNGHTIYNLTLVQDYQNGMYVAGLFNILYSGRELNINNLELNTVNSTSSKYAAAVVAYNSTSLTINMNNVDVDGATISAETVAALVGYTTGPVNLTNCDVSGLALTGQVEENKVGALVGTANTATCAVTTNNCTNSTDYGDYGRVITGATWNGK